MKPWKLDEVKYSYVRQIPYKIAMLPIGATEPHNLHMPYGTDTLTTTILGDLICEKAHSMGAKVALLPAIPYGVNTNQLSYPMVISLNPSTLDVVIRDIIVSLETQGVRKLVLLNGHGGNDFKHTLREFYGKTQVHLSLINWYQVAADYYDELFTDAGDHAGEMETSIGMYLFPELVDVSLADKGQVKTPRLYGIQEGWVNITRPWHILTTNTGVGNPHPATKEKGEKLVQIIVERVSRYLKELSETPIDDSFPYKTEDPPANPHIDEEE